MEKDFKFLTVINGIFYKSNTEGVLNMVDTLTVFYNFYSNEFKIYYKSVLMDDLSDVKKGEITLKNIGYMEYELIYNNFENPAIKMLIFNKYQDMIGNSLYVDKIY